MMTLPPNHPSMPTPLTSPILMHKTQEVFQCFTFKYEETKITRLLRNSSELRGLWLTKETKCKEINNKTSKKKTSRIYY